MTVKKVLKVCSNLITTLLLVLLIFMVIVVVSTKVSGGEPQFWGYQLKTVLSGSMEPTFQTGSIIAIKQVEDPNSLNKDDVITFMETEDKLITHRIIEIIKNGEQTMYKTKGDNNEDTDTSPVLPQNVVGKYTGFTIPYAGYLIEFSQSKNGAALLLILPGLLLIVYSGITIFRGIKELEKTGKLKDVQESN